jgi:ABC-type transport system involved in multi-copper enzyme maturation permease subunit
VSRVVYSETVRRDLTSVWYYTGLAIVAITGFGTARFNSPAAAWPALIFMLAIIRGCTPIGPEFSSGTLQLILVKPVNRSAYLLSRVAGVVTSVWLAAIVACLAELAGRAIFGTPIRLGVFGTALVNVAASSMLAVCVLTLFGSVTRAYFNVAIYLALQVGISVTMALSVMGQQYPLLMRALGEINRNLFPDEPVGLDGHWLLLVCSNAPVALVAACLFFRLREVPYGGD